MGLARGPDLAPHVAAELRPHAAELARQVQECGRVVEAVLVAHGRGVVERQFLLNRLASAAVDAYATAAVLARASRAARLGLPAAAHEARLAQAWAEEALARVPATLAAARQPRDARHFDLLARLGSDVAADAGQASVNPLNL